MVVQIRILSLVAYISFYKIKIAIQYAINFSKKLDLDQNIRVAGQMFTETQKQQQCFVKTKKNVVTTKFDGRVEEQPSLAGWCKTLKSS